VCVSGPGLGALLKVKGMLDRKKCLITAGEVGQCGEMRPTVLCLACWKARHLALILIDTNLTLFSTISNVWPADLGGLTSCPRKVGRPLFPRQGSGAWQAASDRANLCIGYMATLLVRCHKAVLCSLLGFEGRKGGARQTTNTSVEATFSSPSRQGVGMPASSWRGTFWTNCRR